MAVGFPLAGDEPAPVVFEATVVGLMKRTLFSTAAIVPHGRAIELARKVQGDPDLHTPKKFAMFALVQVDREERSAEVVEEIKKRELGARSEMERYAAFQSVFLVINSALSLVGGAALVVAALGIANTLLMSVYERTREIGLYLALGASRKTIRRLFSLEAAAIGLIGGLVGVGIALLVGEVVNVAFHVVFPNRWEGYDVFTFPLWLLLGTVGFAVLVATVAGLYPAQRASRLDPIAALRYD
jgi:putative ABC transport system permease protein